MSVLADVSYCRRAFLMVATLLVTTTLTLVSPASASDVDAADAQLKVECEDNPGRYQHCEGLLKDDLPQQFEVPRDASGTGFLDEVDVAVLAKQELLISFSGWMTEFPNAFDEGFVGAANYAEEMRVVQLWAGSSKLQVTVRQEALERGIDLEIREVEHARPELDQAMDELFDLSEARDPALQGFWISSVEGTNLEHDGLIVKGHFPESKLEPLEPTIRHRLTESAIREMLGDVVVAVVVETPSAPLRTRSTDTWPFYSGGMMRATGSYRHCTSGFGVYVPGAVNGPSHATTARHCDASSYSAWDRPQESYGINSGTTTAGGKVLSSKGHWRMFDGSWNNSDGFWKQTVGYADVVINDYVCTSGAMSGAHCWQRVTSTYNRWHDGYGSIPIVYASAISAPYYAAAPGDSGGPVMVPYAAGNWSTVGAAGMIQTGLDLRQQPCGSATRDPNAACYSTVGFTPMRTIVSSIGGGATLQTTP